MWTQKIRNDFDRIALHEQEGWNHNSHYYSVKLVLMVCSKHFSA